MSGIVVSFTRTGDPDEGAIRRGLDASPQRGSESGIVARGRAILGWQRRATEPIAVAVGARHALVLSGTIDDRDVLASRYGRGLASDADAELGIADILLAAFEQRGEALITELRGAFTLAVTDGETLWVARDQLGLGTAFYRDEGGTAWAGTEAKQVIAAAGRPRRADRRVLETLFYGEEEDDLPSALEGALRLPKASLLVVTPRGLEHHRYWDPASLIERGGIGSADIPERFDQVMDQAARRVLRGREMLALSGGIDSPTLAVYAAPVHQAAFGRPLPALSMVFPDYPACDERPLIDAVATRLGLPVTAYQPDPMAHGSLDRLGDWVALVDGPWTGAWQPAADEERYRMMAALGVDRLLTGDIAEYVMDFRHHLVTHLMWQRRPRALAHLLQVQRRSGASFTTIARRLGSGVVPGSAFRAYRRTRPTFPSPDWVDRSRVRRVAASEMVQPWERWRHQQMSTFRGPGVSLEAHRIHQQSFGMEVRHPWGDVDVWEFFLGLRAEDKFPGPRSKELVRRMMRDRLPREVVDRRQKTLLDDFVKQGFDHAGLQRWISTAPDYRMPGVDYARLADRIERRDLGIFDYLWARDLAAVHAFVTVTG